MGTSQLNLTVCLAVLADWITRRNCSPVKLKLPTNG
jgi:hypothetical protein